MTALVCFHHAGGSASTFRAWLRRAERAGLDLHAVQLPGREERIGEPRHTDLTALVAALAAELGEVLAGPHVLFGQSMGGLVAHHLARHRLAAGLRPPEALVVAACAAPHLATVSIDVDAMTDLELAARLCAIDGLRPELLRRPEWLGPLLAVVKDDLRVCRSHHYTATAPLPLPVHAFGGIDDRLVPASAVVAWEQHTTAAFTSDLVPGGHFLVADPHAGLDDRVFALLDRARPALTVEECA